MRRGVIAKLQADELIRITLKEKETLLQGNSSQGQEQHAGDIELDQLTSC